MIAEAHWGRGAVTERKIATIAIVNASGFCLGRVPPARVCRLDIVRARGFSHPPTCEVTQPRLTCQGLPRAVLKS